MASGETRELKRTIGNRQLSMIAIGGAIGTGLFFASGAAIAQARPGGALLAYATMGLAVYCMMQSLGEMATQLPFPAPSKRMPSALSIRLSLLPSAGITGSAGPLRWRPNWSPVPSS